MTFAFNGVDVVIVFGNCVAFDVIQLFSVGHYVCDFINVKFVSVARIICVPKSVNEKAITLIKFLLFVLSLELQLLILFTC